MTWPDHDDLGDSFSQQVVEERHDGHGRLREPVKERVNEKYNLSNYPHHRHHQPRHHHRRHIQNNLDRHEPSKAQALQETRIAKPNRNKRRKILTQGSLAMNVRVMAIEQRRINATVTKLDPRSCILACESRV